VLEEDEKREEEMKEKYTHTQTVVQKVLPIYAGLYCPYTVS